MLAGYTGCMYNHWLYFAYWLASAVVLLLASIIPDTKVILGNWRFNNIEASIYSGFWLTFLYWVWWDFAIQRRIYNDNKTVSFLIFLIVNSIGVWVVSVFHYIIGFQLLGYPWALGIGIVLTIAQSIAWRIVVRR